ncbi:NAD(P)/FAD-dependent oxidoreductase [Alicyclobacillus sp. ALC3]|uniref:NAD(P)/FAD-dependent oxidoreductase n=1 Tax=Alicyclobacillus sp. ALC3 TaxID=2796143 RepID=UPI00237868D7|nr:NAD(P)/FAD-dependent oxidoreductase [Alicyclobacillus sp. ALC3]WDL96285.1 NAD(P)/FAD-dependent oxidoreductase [Alicyclobacillus sp. ALC3]
MFDVIVIGGGPSGLMAASAASEAGANTLLLEKGDKLGRKLGISGGGRCNVTNAKALPELMQNIPGNGRFLHSALTQFANTDIIAFFENQGIALKEEDRGRVFPVSDKAATVVHALVQHVYDVGTTVWTEAQVRRLLFGEGDVNGVQLRDGQTLRCRSVIVAAGGCSAPHTGSTGDAYAWAKAAGHTVVEPYPTEVPLTSDSWWVKSRALQGISLRDTQLTVKQGNKKLSTESGDMLFTHFGLSGPAALRCSHYVSTALRKDPQTKLTVQIAVLPQSEEEIEQQLQGARKTDARKMILTLLSQWVPERVASVVCKEAELAADRQLANLPQAAIRRLAELLTAFPVSITGTLPLRQATVTGGGVSIREIDPKSMASKCTRGLYFSGEVMDVHAHTGGYNITVAFSTGHAAGVHAAAYALRTRCGVETV